MTHPWIAKLFPGRTPRHTALKPRPRTRLGVESLEDRTVPATFTVVNTLDNGSIGSLRWAVNQANATNGADTIAFAGATFNTAQTITLTAGQLVLTDTSGATTVTGSAAGVTVSGNNASRVVTVNGGVTALFSGLTLSAGNAVMGGGLLNAGAATLTNCTISGNTIGGDFYLSNRGGGVFNVGTLTLAGCTVSGNTTYEGYGAGVYNAGTLTATGSTISGNTSSFGRGGGLANDVDLSKIDPRTGLGPVGSATLINCTISGNAASMGGGVANNIFGNQYVNPFVAPLEAHAALTLINCTIAGNAGTQNVALLGNNTTRGTGGGVGNYHGLTTLVGCTISGNTGGNGFVGAGVGNVDFDRQHPAAVRIQNTIVAGNVASAGRFTEPRDMGGTFQSLGNNLIGVVPDTNPGNIVFSNGYVASDLLNADARLGPLGANGGPTQTAALRPGSAALNAGASGAGIPATDQRGLARVGATDIGAVESQGYTLAPVAGSTPQSAYAGFAFAVPLGARLTELVTNAPLPGVTVSFAVPAAGVGLTVTATQNVTTDAAGVASLAVTANALGGNYTVTATTPGVTATSLSLRNIAVASVAVTPGSPTIAHGLTQQFTATGTYADGATRDITTLSSVAWASATPAVATISPTGLASTFFGSEQFVTRSSVVTASMGGVSSPDATLTVVPVPSHTFTVSSLADAGAGSLRDAIAQAYSAYGHNTIRFDPAVFGTTPRTITLTTGTLTLAAAAFASLDVVGPGADKLTLTAPASFFRNRPFVRVNGGMTASLSGLTFAGGEGAGVDNSGTLTLTRVVVRDIASERILGSTQFDDVVYGVRNSGTLAMIDCTVSGITSVYRTVPVVGVFSIGTLAMTGCTVSGNGDLTNRDQNGIFSSGTTSLVDCTVSNNVGELFGGILFSGAATVIGCTVSGNGGFQSGGIVVRSGTLTLHNSIVAGNSTSGDISGSLVAASSNNLVGRDSALTGIANGVNGNRIGTAAAPINPRLAVLANNGGPTQTHALLPGSPALDAGSNARIPAGDTADQRGLPRISNGTVDIGAFEVQQIPTTTLVATSTAASTYGDSVTFTATVAGAATPTGTVNFVIDGGTPVAGIAGGTPGTWTFTTSTLSAGTHAVQAGFDGTGGFTASTGTLSGGQVVNKATAALVVGGYAGGTYDGGAHTQTVTVTGVPGDGQLYSTSLTETNAGGYSQPWSYSNANYNPVSGTLAFAIARASATVVVTPYTVTYDGLAHAATVASITGANGESGAAVGAAALNTTHTNAGTYSDSWSFAGTANYNDIASTTITNVINKAASAVAVTIVGGPFTYSGLAQTPAAVTVTGAGGLSLTPAATYANNVNAGTATASYSYIGDDNHEASSGSNTFIIGKATAAVTVSGYTGGTYDGGAHTQTVTVTGINGGQLYTTSLSGTNAGGYSLPWSFSTANYNDVSGTLTFAIAKATATVTVTPYTVTYDGTPHSATVASITGVNGESGAAVGAVALYTTNTNAGTYSDSWSFAGTANYNAIASTTITNVINKAALTITANNDIKVYGTLKTFTGTAFTQSGLVNGDALTGVTETSTGAGVSAAVGTYAIVPVAATGTGLDNYAITYVNGTLTVFPALTVPAAQTAYEDVDKTISGITIASGLSGSLSLTLGVGHGTLTLGATTGLTVTGNGSGSVSLVGSTAALNAALATLVYRGSLNFGGADTLSLTVGNGSFSSNASVAITVVSAAQQVAELEVYVNGLVASGRLTSGQGQALNLNLRGNNGDAGKVQAFLNQVAAFRQAGILTQAEADPLLVMGNILLLSVTRR